MKKGTRLLVVLAFVAAGAALAYAGAAPEGYKSVGEVLGDTAAYEGRQVELKATVVEGTVARSGDTVRFLAGDGVHTLDVHWNAAVPLPEHEAGGTLDGKSVVVTGTLVQSEDGLFLLASDMKVGCASKYEAA